MAQNGEISAPSEGILQKNRRWLEALEEGLRGLPLPTQTEVMAAPGRDCASDIWLLCEACLGRPLAGVEDLLQGWNLLRKRLGLDGSWTLMAGHIHGLFGQCGCPLVRSGLAALTPARCLCTQAMMEAIFSRALGKPAQVELVRTLARGDQVCEFRIAANQAD